MSRLYEALRGASRFREAAEGTTGDRVWEALGIKGSEVSVGLAAVVTEEADRALPDKPPADSGSPPVNGTLGIKGSELSALTAVVTEEADSPLPDKPPVDYVSPPVKGALGIPTKVRLDRNARLLPNVVSPIVVERYRMLRTKIMQERENRPFRSLVVTSANPQEGKTVTTLNLAMSFSMLPSFRVLVVDGDMRRGTLGEWLGVDRNRPGLSELIDGSARLEDVVLQSDDLPINFVVRGNSQVSDLDASQFQSHIGELVEQFDLVLVDSPPVNLVTDVQLWAASCDAVLLVARAFHTSNKALEEAVRNLQPFRVIGAVLNGGTANNSTRYHSYY